MATHDLRRESDRCFRRFTQHPSGPRQAIQWTVITGARALRGVVANVEVGNLALRFAEVTQQVIAGPQYLHGGVVQYLVASCLLPRTNSLGKVFQFLALDVRFTEVGPTINEDANHED